jgi:hypothetical protein
MSIGSGRPSGSGSSGVLVGADGTVLLAGAVVTTGELVTGTG